MNPGSGHSVPLPAPEARRLIGLGIAVFLTWQVLLPLGYYRAENRRDERFAWRIFSALAIAPWHCDVRMQELTDGAAAGRDVDLSRTLHDAWIMALRQGQDAVAEGVLRARCASDASVAAVELSRTCRAADAHPAPQMRVRLDCRSGAIVTQEMAG
jgi:hypothetical protein